MMMMMMITIIIITIIIMPWRCKGNTEINFHKL
jgi:hypothetical protein